MTFFAGPTVTDSTTSPPVAAPTNEATQQSLTPNPGSLTSWVKNMLPSHRPERGGTARKRGYWEQSDASDLSVPRIRRRFTDSHQSLNSEASQPDRLTRWNTAKDVSQSGSEAMVPLKRVVSAGQARESSRDSQRMWNWVPQDFLRKSPAALKQDIARASEISTTSLRIEEPSDTDAAALAEQRLLQAQRLMDSKRKARRERRDLKQSGDYLGVQGINPDTGELDIITPTDSDGSSIALNKEQKLQALRDKLKQARDDTQQTAMQTAREAQGIIQALESDSRPSVNKEAIKKLQKAVRWRRQTKQWSSAQEPNLSPIAQSRRSTMPATPEVPDASSRKRISSPVPLIDFNPAGKPDIDPVSSADVLGGVPSRRSSASTIESHGTVVRTPYRQSLDNVSAAALELFENGISFDRSRGDKRAKNAERSAIKGTLLPPGHMAFLDSNDCTGDTSSQLAAETYGFHGSSPKVSFSGKGPGRHPEPVHRCSRPRGGPPTQPFLPCPNSIVHVPSKVQEDHTGPSPGRDRKERRLSLVQKTFESLRKSSPTSQDIGNSLTSDSKGLKKWLPQIRQRIDHAKDFQAEMIRTELNLAEALRSATNLPSHPVEVNASTASLGQILPERTTLEQVQADTERLRLRARGEHTPRLELYRKETDEKWTNITIQEIAKCGKSDHGQSASTRTTITTGFDQAMSPFSQNPGSQEAQEMAQSPSIERPPTSSTIHTEGADTDTLRSVPKTGSSTPPTSAPEVHDRAPDTTSVRQLQGVKARVAKVVGRGTAIATRPAPPSTVEQAIQHTSTSTLQRVCVGNADEEQRSSHSPTKVKAEMHQGVKFEPTQEVQASLTTAAFRVIRRPKEIKLHSPKTHMPGSYPQEGADDVATAGLFRSLVCNLQGIRVPRVLMRLVGMVCLVSLEVIKMYFSVVEPVVDFRSAFWARHAMYSLTWQDGLRVLLAAPGAVLTITAFI